jgi:D-sedoheptulose 7-phosphate isomerase
MSHAPEAESVFAKAIAVHLDVVRRVLEQELVLLGIARSMATALRGGCKIFWCGNGGSAADAQHLAAEIVGRFRHERRGLPSIALTTDSSILTAVANDYGYEQVFARQVEALGAAGDLLVGISTSGNSPNVVAALEMARSMRMTTVAFTGFNGGKVAPLADHHFSVFSHDTARIQEAHILAGHMLCDWIEQDWLLAEERVREIALAALTMAEMPEMGETPNLAMQVLEIL